MNHLYHFKLKIHGILHPPHLPEWIISIIVRFILVIVFSKLFYIVTIHLLCFRSKMTCLSISLMGENKLASCQN